MSGQSRDENLRPGGLDTFSGKDNQFGSPNTNKQWSRCPILMSMGVGDCVYNRSYEFYTKMKFGTGFVRRRDISRV